MPSVQRGSVIKRGSMWAARWYDESGSTQVPGRLRDEDCRTRVPSRPAGGGDRRAFGGEMTSVPRTRSPRCRNSSARFLMSHDVDPATTNKLRYELKHAKRSVR